MVACIYNRKQLNMKYDKRIGNSTERIACSYTKCKKTFDIFFFFNFEIIDKCLYLLKINHRNSVRERIRRRFNKSIHNK